MTKNLTIIFALLLGTLFCQAQVTVNGVVKDSLGAPLELANVIAINKETKGLESYAITNNEGRFRLNLTSNTTYTVQVSYIGMKTFNEDLTTTDSDLDKTYTLQVDNSLDEIELTYEMPVTIKGDTLVYNADSFNKGTERKLEDVLKNLPGVEVNDDGEIEVEGKTVSKVMVDGKDFFDGDSKLATKNIPANAVDKVQVLKNFAEVGQLRTVTNNQDNIAINIKLKEGKKNFWFGNVTAGTGAFDEDGLYLAQPKLFYYSPKVSVNLIGDLNNIGEVAFTRRDYFNFTGGFRQPNRNSGTNINLGNNNLGFLTLQNNRAKSITTRFGAGNFSYSPNKKLDISGFAIFSNSENELQERNAIEYTNSDLGIPDEETESLTDQNSDLGMLKLSAAYKPNVNNQLDYDVLARLSKETQNQAETSSVIGSTDQLETIRPYSINQNLNYYYTLDEKNIFAFEAQHLIQDEDPFYNAFLESTEQYQNTADALGLDDNQIGYNVSQNKRVQSNQLDAKLDYYYILNQKSNFNFTAGTILSNQQFNSNIFQFLDDGTIFNPTPTINNGLAVNDTEYNFSDYYLGAHYRFKTGKFTFNPGLTAHLYNTNNTQLGERFENNFFRLLPDLDIRMDLKKSENLSLRYGMQTDFTDVTQLARGLVLNNYDALYFGNETLDNAIFHNIRLSYFSFNMFNYTNVFATVSYQNKTEQIRTQSNFESVIRTTSPFNSAFADESVNAFGRFQRTFKKIRASLNTNFNYSKFNQFIQGQRSLNETFSQTYDLELRTNFRNAPNIELGYRYSINNNNQGDNNTKFFTSVPSVEFDAYIWKKVTFRTDFLYNSLSDDDGFIRDFKFWNASLSYRNNKDAKLEYVLKATNILDIQSQNNNGASAFSAFETEYFVQPRYVTFRLIYEL